MVQHRRTNRPPIAAETYTCHAREVGLTRFGTTFGDGVPSSAALILLDISWYESIGVEDAAWIDRILQELSNLT